MEIQDCIKPNNYVFVMAGHLVSNKLLNRLYLLIGISG